MAALPILRQARRCRQWGKPRALPPLKVTEERQIPHHFLGHMHGNVQGAFQGTSQVGLLWSLSPPEYIPTATLPCRISESINCYPGDSPFRAATKRAGRVRCLQPVLSWKRSLSSPACKVWTLFFYPCSSSRVLNRKHIRSNGKRTREFWRAKAKETRFFSTQYNELQINTF